LIRGHESDLGGNDLLSESEKSLIRRASAIECELELSEGRLSRGETVDLDKFTRAASHLRRILETLGLQRRPREVQTLGEYLASRAEETATDAFDPEDEAELPAEDETPLPARPSDSSEPPE
jgi:hypothetical protein